MSDNKQSGPGCIEYALVLILVAIMVLAIMIAFWYSVVKSSVPWIMNTGMPFMGVMLKGAANGNPTAILVLVVIILVVSGLLYRAHNRAK